MCKARTVRRPVAAVALALELEAEAALALELEAEGALALELADVEAALAFEPPELAVASAATRFALMRLLRSLRSDNTVHTAHRTIISDRTEGWQSYTYTDESPRGIPADAIV